MSEITSAYYLKTRNQNDAVDLIKKSGRSGFVLPEKNGWVTFVVDTDIAQDEILFADELPGTLLYLLIAAGYEWEFTLFTNEREAVSFRCLDPEECSKSIENLDSKDYIRHIGKIYLYEREADWNLVEEALKNFEDYSDMKNALEEYLIKENTDARADLTVYHSFIVDEADEFCEMMGLFFTNMISYENLESDVGDIWPEGMMDYDGCGYVPVIRVN